jgi:photosystem II stability/assembly factor-like uncharacterized protein/sugar lactone lactonase YvrE
MEGPQPIVNAMKTFLRIAILTACIIADSHLLAQDLRIFDMSFVDDSHGWLMVRKPKSLLFRTTDAGKTWTRTTVPDFLRISFFNRTTGIAIERSKEDELTFFRTSDGGEHWEIAAVFVEKYLHAYDVHWLGMDDAYILGQSAGGAGWIGELSMGKPLQERSDLYRNLPRQDTSYNMFGDGTGHVWIAGKHLLLHSIDKGKTWENQFENIKPNIDRAHWGTAIPGGWAWIEAEHDEVYRTGDYGMHWERGSSPDDDDDGSGFDSISFYSPKDGCAVGYSAFISCTRNGGLTWKRSKVFKTYLEGSPEQSKILLFPSGQGWATVAGALYKTLNGGRSFVEVPATGPIMKFSGTRIPALSKSVNGPTSIAYDRKHGCLYIVEWEQQQLLRMDLKAGSLKTLLTRSEAERANEDNFPHSVAVDGQGNIYIGDFTGRIRLLNGTTGQLSVLVRESPDPLNHFQPYAMIVDSSGRLLVTAGHSILRYSSQHRLAPFIGIGAHGIAISSDGDIYVTDRENCRINKIDHETKRISPIAGTGNCADSGDGGPASSASVYYPESIVIDGKNNLFFVDGHCIRRIDADGIISTYAGTGEAGFSGDDGPAENAKLNNPSGLALDENGNLYISEFVNNRIRRVDAVTKIIKTIAGDGHPHRVE